MIELDGIEYNVSTPQENAEAMVTYINDYCSANNILNSKGELVQIEVNPTNPLYEICFGLGYLTSIMQKLIYNAGCSLNIPRASDRQLLNLAEIANVKPKKATKTTFTAMIYADRDIDVDPQPCHITMDLTMSLIYGGKTITFSPAYETIIPVGGSVSMIMICNDEGSYSIPAGSFTEFDTEVTGLHSIVSYASIPGQDAESASDLRSRIQARAITSTQLDRAAADITQLDGVSLCSIYFNYSNINSTIVSGITVPPRQAVLFVQGYSDKIAETFYNHLSCLTAQGPTSLEQVYTTHAGQQLSVYITPPTALEVYIQVYLGQQVISSVIDGIKETIASLSSSLTIGQTLTSAMVVDVIQSNFPGVNIQGAALSLDNTVYTYRIMPQSNELCTFNYSKIAVVENV